MKKKETERLSKICKNCGHTRGWHNGLNNCGKCGKIDCWEEFKQEVQKLKKQHNEN